MRGAAPGREGPRPRAARRSGRASDAAGARLHGRRSVHRPGRAAAAGRPADLRPLRRGDRHPAGARRPGSCAARSGSSSRAATTCCCAARWRPASPTRSAASRRSARTSPTQLLPLVEDTGWFFDTELLVLAERAGLRIHEVPVDWVDDPDSRVDIVADRDRRPARHRPGRAGPGDRRGCRSPQLRASSAGHRPRCAVGGRAARPDRADACGSPPSASSARWRTWCCSSLLRHGLGAQTRQPGRAAGHRGRQHRRQPAAHLRRRGRRDAARHQLQGLFVFGLGLGAHQRVAGRLHAVAPEPAEDRRTRRPGDGEPGRDGAAVRPVATVAGPPP